MYFTSHSTCHVPCLSVFCLYLLLSLVFSSWTPYSWLINNVSPPRAPYSTLLSPGQGGRKHREHSTDSILILLLNHWVHSISPFPVYLLQTHIFSTDLKKASPLQTSPNYYLARNHPASALLSIKKGSNIQLIIQTKPQKLEQKE